jgi:branched-chain amino acid transport system ATP-binding protein
MSEAILEVNELVSGYEDINILQGISLRVKRGEIACIIGPNGAGKSTLLKAIFGILGIRRGTISFDGKDVTHTNYVDRLKGGIGYSPQGRVIFPTMTVQENLEMGAYIREDKDVQKDIAAIYEKYPILKEKKDQLAGSLSGGQQHILEMGRSLLLHPKLMLLDEPTAGMSPSLVNEIFKEIKSLNEEGMTILLVEQSAKQALSISDHAFVLELGKKRFEAPAHEIMNNADVKRLYLGG